MKYPRSFNENENDGDTGKIIKKLTIPKKLRKKLLYALGTVLILGACFAIFLSIRFMVRSVGMIDVVGMPKDQAVEAVELLGVKVNVVNAYSEDAPDGQIIFQSRKKGERLKKNADVVLTASMGSQWYLLGDMTGWPLDAALQALNDAGAKTVNCEYTISDAPKETVVSQDVEGGWVSRDTPVTLFVSAQSVVVPDLTGLTQESAKAVIEAEGLKLGLVTEGGAADACSGTIIEQSLEAGSRVLMGTSLDVTICRAQETKYATPVPLTVAIPLDHVRLEIELVAPSGEKSSGYAAILDEGVYPIRLTSNERGVHTVNIYEDGVLFETLALLFE